MAINSLSSSSHGLSGLVSGINTQEMVEKMLSGTQAKINKASQRKTTLQNKQSLYQEVINKLKSLQTNFLSFTSGTNLLSNSFYNTMNAAVNPPTGTTAAFSVTANSSAATGTYTMDYIKQLATARTEKTTKDASGDVAGKLDRNAAGKLVNGLTGMNASLSITVGGKSVTVADAPLTFSGMSQSEVAGRLNEMFTNAQVDATARYTNNKLVITANSADDYVTIAGGNGSATPMAMFGTANTQLSGKGSLSTTLDTDLTSPSFVVNLDGVQKTIYMDLKALKSFADGADNGQALEASVEKQLQRYFGEGVALTRTENAGEVSFGFESGVPSQKFTITGKSDVVNTLGLKSGISNKLSTSLAIKDLNLATGLEGSQHVFSINGVEFSYDSTASLNTIITGINNSKAGIKVSYVESEDRFVMQSAETGKTNATFDIKQSEGNLMSVLFGEPGGMAVTGGGVNMAMRAEDIANDAAIGNGGTYTFNVNGTDYTYAITRGSNAKPFNRYSLADELSNRLLRTFGTMPSGENSIEFEVGQDGKYVLRTNNPNLVVKGTASTRELGFGDQASTRAYSAQTTLEEAGISFGSTGSIDIQLNMSKSGVFGEAGAAVPDENIQISAADLAGKSMAEIAQLMQTRIRAVTGDDTEVTYDTTQAAFRIEGVDIPMQVSVQGGADAENINNLFGTDHLTVGEKVVNAANPGAPARTVTEGQNAVFSLNGAEIQRATNSFTIDGMTFTLNENTVDSVDNTDPANPVYTYKSPTKVTVSRDTDAIVKGMEEYLKQYNETIDFITGMYRSEPTYKDYAPLTDAQKADMSEKEIEQWEEKSKEGLLRNDSGLERILSELRKGMYTKPEGSNIAIYDMGIDTSYYTSDGNFNIGNAADLKSFIESNAEGVRQLFAGEGGIMELVNNAISNATKSSYASPGYLTQVAGSSSLDTTSTIYKQVKELDSQLVSLEDRYWSEYDRYWKQFNAMEQMIQQMNSQSSWLSQLSAG